MPIALFPELTESLRRTGKVMTPWSRLVDIETQLLRRAQSAFLTHWFGTSVPERRLNLYIAIRNVEALQKRYMLAKRSVEPAPSGLNLLGPLSGIAGLIVGMAMSPTGALLIATQMHHVSDLLAKQPWADLITMVYRLVGVFILPVLGPFLALVVGMPLLLMAGIGFAAGGTPVVRAVVSLLGEVALLIDGLGRFWDQLSGPRANIRNPLLRAILETMDRFAGLFVQILGGVGFLLVRLLPLMENIIGQYRALMDLIDAVVAALSDIFTGIVDALLAPFEAKGGLLGILAKVLDTLMSIPTMIIDQVKELIDDAAADLTMATDFIFKEITKFADGFADRLAKAFKASVIGQLVARVKTLLDLLPAFIEAFKAIKEPPKKTGGETAQEKLRGRGLRFLTGGGVFGTGLGDRVADVLDAAERISLPTLPDLGLPTVPSAPTLPDIDALLKAHPRPETPDVAGMVKELTEGAWEAQAKAPVPPEIAKSPASAFAGERRKLEAASQHPVLRLDDARLRDLIYMAVGRILPPALRVYAPDVRAFFDRIDENVYGAPEMDDKQRAAAAAALLPEQDIRDSGQLRPVVHSLRFVAPGGQAVDLRAFRDLVVDAMKNQFYVAQTAG